MELLRSCTKPSIYFFLTFSRRSFLLFLNLKLENYSVFTFLLFLDLNLENYSVFTFLLFLDLQDCSNSSELAMGLLQSCTKPTIYFFKLFSRRTFLLFLNLKLENYSVFTFLLFLDLKLENYSIFRWLSARLVYSRELAMELLRSCTKPSIYFFLLFPDVLFYFFSTSRWKIIPFLRFYFFSTWSWKIIPHLRFYFFSNWSWKVITYLLIYLF